ncbi:MAG: serine/threonine-protein kinase [Victivallaceae bacterium]|jgi:serine/threonine-protein kinase
MDEAVDNKNTIICDNAPAVTQSSAHDSPPGALKVSCHSCLQKLDVSDLEPFSHFSCPSCGADMIAPKWFGNYLLEEQCGQGGMANVYRALDLTLDREVAIKVLKDEISRLEHSASLFLHEARIAAALNHYGIIPIYSCGEFENHPFFVMQFMGNGSLEHQILMRQQIPVDRVLRWMIDIAEGLDSARRHGIIHHDVKPGNILLDSDGNVKIGDFGIAHAIFDNRSSQLVEVTGSWGSPHYVSPEKLEEGKEDFPGDIFSLGATFYELLTGIAPFDSSEQEEMLKMRRESAFTPVNELRSDVTPALASLIRRMLAYEPLERPGYREIIRELNSVLKIISPHKEDHKRKIIAADIPFYLQIKYYVIAVLCLITIIPCGMIIYNNSRKAAKTIPEKINNADLLSSVSAALASGDSAHAASIAAFEFENVKSAAKVRRQAAMVTALCAYLNNDDQAADKCAAVSQRLAAAGVPAADKFKIIIDFLANPALSGKYLTDNIPASETEAWNVASFALFVKNLYSHASRQELTKNLTELQNNLSTAAADSWPRKAWAVRIPAYRECIINGKIPTENIEPIFAR